MAVKAAVFDFDYTLGDSSEGIVQSINHALKKLGFGEDDPDRIKKTIGMSLPDALFYLTGYGDREQARLFSAYFREKPDPEGLLFAVRALGLEQKGRPLRGRQPGGRQDRGERGHPSHRGPHRNDDRRGVRAVQPSCGVQRCFGGLRRCLYAR